ncbi:MAG TPA: hypothetical protein VLA24_17835 [Pseudomonadales bacterium]|nr:hypothetical protein [Pseudomonadales bacterium]
MVNENLRLTQDEFLRRCIEVHGSKFDYSQAVYVNYSTKVSITCNQCGNTFNQIPASHYNGNGCPNCRFKNGGKERFNKSAQKFTVKARTIHGEQYDYSRTVYAGAKKSVTIFCKRCNSFFEKIAQDHLKGQGCQKCAYAALGRSRTMDTAEFIEKSKSIHGDRYDYSKSNYVSSHKKVAIICPDHGEFRQAPKNHLAGRGCVKCRFRNTEIVMTSARIETLEKARLAKIGMDGPNKLTTEQFIADSLKIHGNRYDYSKVKYKTAKHKVIIICPAHGEFCQSATSHKSGTGCPKCSTSKGEQAIASFLDKFEIAYEQEKTFPKCKDRQVLQFDFYFEYQGVHFVVEYQGIHHYKPVAFFEREGRVKHEWYVKHDEIKRKFAKKYGFVMIEIPYTESDIDSYLASEISKHLDAGATIDYPIQLTLFV